MSSVLQYIVAKQPEKKCSNYLEEKYKPKCKEDYLANDEAKSVIQDYINFERCRILFLYGYSGKQLLCNLFFYKDSRFSVIYFDDHNTIDKKVFFETIVQLSGPQNRSDCLRRVLIFVKFEHFMADTSFNKYYKTVTSMVSGTSTTLPLIVFISASRTLKKVYKKTKIQMCYIERLTQEIIQPKLEALLTEENYSMPQKCLQKLIQQSDYNLQVIYHKLHILFLRYAKGFEFKSTHLNLLSKYAENDTFYSAHDILESVGASNKKTKRTFDDFMQITFTEQILIIDLVYSNAPCFMSLEQTSEVLDDMSYINVYTSPMNYNVYNFYRELFVHVMIIFLLLKFQNYRNSRKKIKCLNNQLNNLPLLTSRNHALISSLSRTNVLDFEMTYRLVLNEMKTFQDCYSVGMHEMAIYTKLRTFLGLDPLTNSEKQEIQHNFFNKI
jgi:hypothetical protein